MMQRMKLISLSLVAAICTTLLTPQITRAADPKDILTLVPDDAMGFVILRSLSTVDQKMALLKQTLDLPIPPQATPIVLGQLFGAKPVAPDIDGAGPIGMILLDIQKYGAGGMDSAIVLVFPTKNPKALLKTLDAGDPEDGLYACSLQGQALSAAIRDKFVIFGKSPEGLKAVAKSEKRSGGVLVEARRSVLDKSDVFVSVSIRGIPAMYKEMLMGLVRMATAPTDPEGKTAKQLEKILAELDAIEIGAGLTQKGFTLRYLVVPKKDSDLESLLKDTKTTDQSLLTVLPKEKFLFAIGTTGGYSEHAAKFGDQNILSSIFSATHAEGVDEAAVKTIDEETLKLIKALGPTAMSISALPGGSHGMFGFTAVVETSDPKAFLGGCRKIYKTLWTLSDDEDFEEIKDHFIHKEDAETIAGNKTDTLTVNIKGFADILEMEEEDLNVVEQVVGKDVVFRFGAVGDKHFVIAFGGGKARFEKICKAVTSGTDGSLAQDKGIGALSKQLPSPRSSEIYLALDNILQAVKSLMKITGDENGIPFDPPTVNAPLALSGAQVGSIQRGDFVVPMKLITAVKKLIDQQMKAEMAAFDEDDGDADEDHGNKEDDDDKDHHDDDDDDG